MMKRTLDCKAAYQARRKRLCGGIEGPLQPVEELNASLENTFKASKIPKGTIELYINVFALVGLICNRQVLLIFWGSSTDKQMTDQWFCVSY